MLKTISSWWNKERVNRAEKGTSQDYCPTNGGLIMYVSIICFLWTSYIIVLQWVYGG